MVEFYDNTNCLNERAYNLASHISTVARTFAFNYWSIKGLLDYNLYFNYSHETNGEIIEHNSNLALKNK